MHYQQRDYKIGKMIILYNNNNMLFVFYLYSFNNQLIHIIINKISNDKMDIYT